MGLGTLAQVLQPLHDTFDSADHPDLLVGLDSADDAAVYRVSDDLALIQTLDFFPPVVDDPYTYGAIGAANAMSDVYAMGGEVRFALNIAGFPEDLDPEILAEIFRGGAEKVREAGGVIAGGHTVFDAEPKYGLSVTGMIHPAAVITKGGAQAGDALLLTKPIGTGVLLTAAQQDYDGAQAGLEAAVTSMLKLNRHASHLARAAGVNAMTDVTGFALLGHTSEMALQSGLRFTIDANAVPLLEDAHRFARAGAVTGGGSRNREQLGERVALPDGLDDTLAQLLFDPQTSGGLLIAVPEAEAEALRAQIEAEDGGCWQIGSVEAGEPGVVVR
jgi:selenide, water dikinase